MTCENKHDFCLVVNRYYKDGTPVLSDADWGDDSEWRTETRCKDCDVLFNKPE